MNCSEWEERIALYAGGDLAPAEAQAVERHAAGCAGCQLLLSGVRESLGMLREAHQEPIDAAHFAAVRARVVAELRHGSARRWRWAWVASMAAAAVLLAALWPRPERGMIRGGNISGGRNSSAPARVPAPQAGVPAPRPLPAVSMVYERGSGRLRVPSETVLMKIESNDPDVVIYWIAETKGETK